MFGFKKKPKMVSLYDEELLRELDCTKREMEEAFANFQDAVDPDLVDSYIYEENAAQMRYQFLMKQIKNSMEIKEQLSQDC